MEETKQSTFPSRGPMLSRLLLWLAFGVMLVLAMRWPTATAEFRWRFDLRGNPTSLYVVLSGAPVDAEAEGDAAIVYSRFGEPQETWSDVKEHRGDVVATVAWQEDLVALFADGGLSFIGPEGLGYQPAPIKGVGGWQWITAAGEGARLMALGLDADGRPVFSERGRQDWGDLQPVDPKVKWSAETAATAASEVRKGEFHVVWTEQPVAETPIGEGPRRRWLQFAYRDAAGAWHGPFEEKSIHPAGPLCLAPFGDKLAMVFMEAAADDATDQPPGLAYAEFTPGDRRWHRVRGIALPPKDGEPQTPDGYGFARFRDGHVLALHDPDGAVTALEMDADTGRLSPMAAPPELVATAAVKRTPPQFPTWWFLAMVALAVIMVLVFRAVERRAIRARLAASPEPSREAARIMAAQVERLMYLPVLLRRIGAVLIDLLIITLPAAVAMSVLGLMPTKADLVVQSDQWLPSDSLSIAGMILTALMVVYYLIMELIWQRTLGKMACRVHVVDLSGGRPVWWRIVVRNLLRPVDFLVMGLVGLFFIVWTPLHQRLGDLAAGTRVVKAERASGGPQDTDMRAG